jgi:hypothetical protein
MPSVIMMKAMPLVRRHTKPITHADERADKSAAASWIQPLPMP